MADGFSKTRLVRMHEVLAGHVERGSLPGLVALVSRRGAVHVDVIGTKALGGAEPMERDSIFRIASVTKPVIAVAALMLAEDCLFSLDEPIDRLLPELANQPVLRTIDAELDDTVPARRPVTIRDLLTFRNGLGMNFQLDPDSPISKAIAGVNGFGPPQHSHEQTPDEWIAQLADVPLMYQPGERWLYNTGIEMLGVLRRWRGCW